MKAVAFLAALKSVLASSINLLKPWEQTNRNIYRSEQQNNN